MAIVLPWASATPSAHFLQVVGESHECFVCSRKMSDESYAKLVDLVWAYTISMEARQPWFEV